MSTQTAPRPLPGSGNDGGNDGGGRRPLGYLAGVGTVFQLETRQRLRTRSWYVMLAVWFVAIALVTVLAALSVGSEPGANDGIGQVMFELVVGFVLLFGLLVAPALSANSITGDRAAGTLAILQNTLLTPGQLLWGKWLAAWVASLGFLVVSVPLVVFAMSYGDVYLPGVPVFLLLTALELGIACAIGVGISAVSGRPLFAIVATYLLIAMLGLGTLIAYGLSFQLVKEQVTVSEQLWPNDPWSGVKYDDNGRALDADGQVIEDQDAYFAELDRKSTEMQWDPNGYVCGTNLYPETVFHTERITWLLAANPFVVVADAVPAARPEGPAEDSLASSGPMAGISGAVRMSQGGPEAQTPCLDGQKRAAAAPFGATEAPPLWPLGLGLQGILAGGLLALGRRRLVTPAGRLAAGTRIA